MRAKSQHRSRPSTAGRRLAGDEGQAIVEAVIVLPAMVFLILVVLQLTMIQHARIMTDYAAYAAARAGVVFNGDSDAMQRAATIALSPTMGRTDTLGSFQATVLGGAGNNSAPAEIALARTFNLPGLIEIDKLPPPTSAGSPSAYGGHLGNQELDFDDIRTGAAQWNILQLRVRYFYRMNVPYANQMLQAIYMAAVGAPNLLTNWRGVETVIDDQGGNFLNSARGAYAGSNGGVSAGMAVVPMSAQIVAASYSNVFYFPLQATYSMRMQSNWYSKNLP